MGLRTPSLRQYGFLVGVGLLLFTVLSVWWTAPPENDYVRTEPRAYEQREEEQDTSATAIPPVVKESVGESQTVQGEVPGESKASENLYRHGQHYLRGEG